MVMKEYKRYIKSGKRHSTFNITWAWRLCDINIVLDKLNNTMPPVIHVCSGSSGIGDYRVDVSGVGDVSRSDTERNTGMRGTANIIGDMCNLPIKSGCAGAVVCDPPYDYHYLDFTDGDPLINELVRILKPRGTLLFYAPWVYTTDCLTLKDMIPMRTGKKREYFKILSESIKSNGQIGDYS